MALIDSVTSLSAKTYFNLKLGNAGKVTELSVDSTAKKLRVVAELVGEAEAVMIEVLSYEKVSFDGKNVIWIKSVRSSKLWVERLLEGKKVPVPSKVAIVL